MLSLTSCKHYYSGDAHTQWFTGWQRTKDWPDGKWKLTRHHYYSKSGKSSSSSSLPSRSFRSIWPPALFNPPILRIIYNQKMSETVEGKMKSQPIPRQDPLHRFLPAHYHPHHAICWNLLWASAPSSCPWAMMANRVPLPSSWGGTRCFARW